MEVKVLTKYDVGEKVYRLNECTNKLEEFVIQKVWLCVCKDNIAISYSNGNYNLITPENRLYKSKEEFIQQL